MVFGHVVCFMVLFCSFVDIIKASRLRSEVTTIKTKHGVIYDCVDFHEQPAFKHPLLRNHSFHPKMRPGPLPKWLDSANTWSLKVNETKMTLVERVTCREGTVPIKRVNKDNLAKPTGLSQNSAQPEPGIHRAILQTSSSPNEMVYYGIGGFITVWKPQVKANQYSVGQCTIQNGPDSIRIGWMVNPTMYNNDEPYMFIYTNAGGTHCYNVDCPGFVLLSPDKLPFGRMNKYSRLWKEPVGIGFLIYRDQATGNWWLGVGEDLTRVGFWPENIFTSLGTHGSYIACGGETYNQPGQQEPDPPMGSGIFPQLSIKASGAVTNFVTVNEKFQTVDVVDHTETYLDDRHEYNVIDGHVIKGLGRVVFYGGNGS